MVIRLEITVGAKNVLKKIFVEKLLLVSPAEASNVTRQGGDGTRPGATPFINDFLVPGQHFTCNNSANERPASCCIDQSETLSTRIVITLCGNIQSTEIGGQIRL